MWQRNHRSWGGGASTHIVIPGATSTKAGSTAQCCNMFYKGIPLLHSEDWYQNLEEGKWMLRERNAYVIWWWGRAPCSPHLQSVLYKTKNPLPTSLLDRIPRLLISDSRKLFLPHNMLFLLQKIIHPCAMEKYMHIHCILISLRLWAKSSGT